MVCGISTHLFLPERLTPSTLDLLREAGAESIEVFAGRHHFDYTDRGAVRELSQWFRSNPVTATMHMPIFAAEDEASWSRHTAACLNLVDAAKGARIAAMDEVKRALEAAEQVPFRSCVIHLGLKDDEWDTRTLDAALTSIEHLKAFASPLGVRLLLENLTNAVATPEHLVELVRVGHFATVGFCLDVGHANLSEGLAETRDRAAQTGIDRAFAVFASAGDGRLAELHLHDNGGFANGTGRDEHCWPGDGKAEWSAVRAEVAKLPKNVVGTLEIGYDLADKGAGRQAVVRAGLERACRLLEPQPAR